VVDSGRSSKPRSRISPFVWLIPIVALGVALLEMPYGYYQLLRVLVFCVAAYLAFESAKRSETSWAWVLGGIALIYNPLVRLALGRDIWEVVNIATIGVLCAHLGVTLRKHRTPKTDP
jgi:hypothetical protein